MTMQVLRVKQGVDKIPQAYVELQNRVSARIHQVVGEEVGKFCQAQHLSYDGMKLMQNIITSSLMQSHMELFITQFPPEEALAVREKIPEIALYFFDEVLNGLLEDLRREAN